MPPSKTRFITACQQLLALGVVLAALTPAAGVVTLDVVRESPGGHDRAPVAHRTVAGLAAYTRAQSRRSVVPTQVVDPKVTEYSLTPPAGARGRSVALAARSVPAGGAGGAEVTSRPEAVVGYGAVGVTWSTGERVPEDQIALRVRTRTGATWSDWMRLGYDADHAPDPDSAEGRHARPGTDALLVGDVDQVQVRATTTGRAAPPDMRMAVVDPGRAATSAVEAPALDTNTMDGATPPPATEPPATGPAEGQETEDGLALEAATYTPKPVIYSRAQWGADERMRDKSSLHYFEVHAGFVHHTVNANDYTRAEVPAIIRSIYAYHTQSRGWSDIGYNFLVDRFGRIWEGRYGGIDRPVVGAHTLNYNDYAFAMSAIGNYDIHQPSSAMVQAYGALFAWKLSLHGVDASSTKQWVGSRYFQAINGHRDAASTACPGRYLYAKIPVIRTLAARAQRGWSGRELESDLASTPHPDLIVRRASDGQGFIIPTGGGTAFSRARTSTIDASSPTVASPDLTGDGRGDLAQLVANTLVVRPGDGAGGFGAALAPRALSGHDLLTAVGDLNGDGRNDLVARRTDGRLDLYEGNGAGRFTRRTLGWGFTGYDLLAATGDLDGDGRNDLLARKDGRLWRFPGAGGHRLLSPVAVPGSWGRYATITGYGDFSGDDRPDLLVARAGRSGAIRPSRPDGSFGHSLGQIAQVANATRVTAADVAGGTAPDIVGVRAGGLVEFTNRGTFEAGRPIATGLDLSSADTILNVGDWNRDGLGDIVMRSAGSLFLFRGDGRGHFSAKTRIATGFGGVRLLAAVGDMTGDGWPDLMGQPAGQSMRIYPGNGVDGLRASYVAYGAIDASSQVAVGRWDGDGAPDSLFRQGSSLTLFPGNGPGGLTHPTRLGADVAAYDWVIGVSDLALRGHPYVIVRARRTGDLWALRATASGFQPRTFLAEGMGAYDLAG